MKGRFRKAETALIPPHWQLKVRQFDLIIGFETILIFLIYPLGVVKIFG